MNGNYDSTFLEQSHWSRDEKKGPQKSYKKDENTFLDELEESHWSNPPRLALPKRQVGCQNHI